MLTSITRFLQLPKGKDPSASFIPSVLYSVLFRTTDVPKFAEHTFIVLPSMSIAGNVLYPSRWPQQRTGRMYSYSAVVRASANQGTLGIVMQSFIWTTNGGIRKNIVGYHVKQFHARSVWESAKKHEIFWCFAKPYNNSTKIHYNMCSANISYDKMTLSCSDARGKGKMSGYFMGNTILGGCSAFRLFVNMFNQDISLTHYKPK
jgi:hypothetical protein